MSLAEKSYLDKEVGENTNYRIYAPLTHHMPAEGNGRVNDRRKSVISTV